MQYFLFLNSLIPWYRKSNPVDIAEVRLAVLSPAALGVVVEFGQESGFSMRCMELSKRLFSADTAVRQIVRAVSGGAASEPVAATGTRR